jgi:hypothetical protein
MSWSWLKLLVSVAVVGSAGVVMAMPRPASRAVTQPSLQTIDESAQGDLSAKPTVPSPDVTVNGHRITLGANGRAHIAVPDGSVDVDASDGHSSVSAHVGSTAHPSSGSQNLNVSVQSVTVNGSSTSSTHSFSSHVSTTSVTNR